MHELALAADRDHVEFLLDAVNRDVPELAPKPGPNVNFNPDRASGVIKLCAEKAGWGKKLPKGSGLGLAWCYSHARPCRGSRRAQRGRQEEDHGAQDHRGRRMSARSSTWRAPRTRPGRRPSTACPPPWGWRSTSRMAASSRHNYNDYPLLRMPQRAAGVRSISSSRTSAHRMGEPALPPLAGALGNAIFAATGERVRHHAA